MERSTAISLIEQTGDIAERLDAMCITLREISDLDERKKYVLIVATLLADLSTDFMLPLAKLHPGIIDPEPIPES